MSGGPAPAPGKNTLQPPPKPQEGTRKEEKKGCWSSMTRCFSSKRAAGDGSRKTARDYEAEQQRLLKQGGAAAAAAAPVNGGSKEEEKQGVNDRGKGSSGAEKGKQPLAFLPASASEPQTFLAPKSTQGLASLGHCETSIHVDGLQIEEDDDNSRSVSASPAPPQPRAAHDSLASHPSGEDKGDPGRSNPVVSADPGVKAYDMPKPARPARVTEEFQPEGGQGAADDSGATKTRKTAAGARSQGLLDPPSRPLTPSNFKSHAAISISAELAIGASPRGNTVHRPAAPAPPPKIQATPPSALPRGQTSPFITEQVFRKGEAADGSSRDHKEPATTPQASPGVAPPSQQLVGLARPSNLHSLSSTPRGNDMQEAEVAAPSQQKDADAGASGEGRRRPPVPPSGKPPTPSVVPKLALGSVTRAVPTSSTSSSTAPSQTPHNPPGHLAGVSTSPNYGVHQYEQRKASVLPMSRTPMATPRESAATPDPSSDYDHTRVLNIDGSPADCAMIERIITDTIPAVKHCMLVRHWTSPEIGCLFTIKTSEGGMNIALDVAALQLAFDSGSEATTVMSARQCPRFRHGLSLQVQEANRKIPKRVVQVRRFQVLREDFSCDNGQLTPYGEIERGAVVRRYKHIINDMYQHEHTHEHRWMTSRSGAEEAYHSPRTRPNGLGSGTPRILEESEGSESIGEGDVLSRYPQEGDMANDGGSQTGRTGSTPRVLPLRPVLTPRSNTATPRGNQPPLPPPGGGVARGVGGQITTPRSGSDANVGGVGGRERLPDAGLLSNRGGTGGGQGNTTPRVMGAYSPASTVGAVTPFEAQCPQGKSATSPTPLSPREPRAGAGRRRGSEATKGSQKRPIEAQERGGALAVIPKGEGKEKDLGTILLEGLQILFDGDEGNEGRK